MNPEAQAREKIDALLTAAGWHVCDATAANIHVTLKTIPLQREVPDEFVKYYNPENRYQRQIYWSDEALDGHLSVYDYDDLISCNKANLDCFRLKEKSLSDSDILPEPEVIAAKIVEDLKVALEQYQEFLADLGWKVERVEA